MNGNPPCCIMCSMGAIVFMQYPIFEGEKLTGEVILEKEGLYCRLHCFYTAKKPESLRLICCGEKTHMDLGGGVPKGNQWEIRRFFPWRNLPGGELTFKLESGRPKEKMFRQRLVPGQPVEQISVLVTGKLVRCEDGYWIQEIKEQ